MTNIKGGGGLLWSFKGISDENWSSWDLSLFIGNFVDTVSEVLAASFFRVAMPINISYFNSGEEQLYECD
jgi:hypothetical protein